MLIIILMFFFTNVYLWHDQATRQMNDVLSTKMNSPVSMIIGPDGNLNVTNNGGVDVALSRLWVTSDSLHLFADFESLADKQPWVSAGSSTEIDLNSSAPVTNISPLAVTWDNSKNCSVVQYAVSGNVTFRIVTANGNSAGCSIRESNSQTNNGTATYSTSIGAVVIADFQNFTYYNVTGNTNPYTINLASGDSGNLVNSNGSNVALRVNLTNIDPQNRSIFLNNRSQLFFVFAASGGATVGYVVLYIVNVAESGNLGTISSSYPTSGIELQPKKPTTVYFAAKKAVADSPGSFVPANITQAAGCVCPLNIALLGKIGNNTFGQNIPFMSVYVNS